MHIVHYSEQYDDIGEAMDKPDGLAVVALFFEVSISCRSKYPSRLKGLKHESFKIRMLISQLSASDNHLMKQVTEKLHNIPYKGWFLIFLYFLVTLPKIDNANFKATFRCRLFDNLFFNKTACKWIIQMI